MSEGCYLIENFVGFPPLLPIADVIRASPPLKGKSNDPVIRMNPDPEGSGGSGGSGGEFGMEFVLTFIVVYAFCASRDAR